MLTDELMREVRRIEIRAKRRVNDLLGGEYHSAFRGSGVEFAEVRAYEPGDDVRFIDWNVTARTGHPYVKRFTEERQLTVMLVVDTSGSMSFGSGSKTKARLAAEAAAIIALAAARNNDRVGLCLYGGPRPMTIKPSKGKTHQLRIIREILDAEAHGTGPTLAETLGTLDRVLPRHAIVFVLSDFLDAIEPGREPDWLRPARLLARRHEPIALAIDDPRERDLPRLGLVELEDPETGEVYLVDLAAKPRRRAVHDRAASERAALAGTLRSAGIDLVELSTDRPVGDDLARFFHERDRKR